MGVAALPAGHPTLDFGIDSQKSHEFFFTVGAVSCSSKNRAANP